MTVPVPEYAAGGVVYRADATDDDLQQEEELVPGDLADEVPDAPGPVYWEPYEVPGGWAYRPVF